MSRSGPASLSKTAGRLACWTLLLATIPSAVRAAPQANPHRSAEGLVRALYETVSFPAGTTPDWDQVRKFFLAEAVVVLRTAPDATTVFTVDGFVADFASFSERADVRRSGFVERIVRLRTLSFGDIAHVLVLYEASIPGSARPPQQGVDSFQLIRRDGRWWIVSVTNELPTPERPVPNELRD